MKPIKPSQVQGKKNAAFPDEVIEAFNELIVENWQGNSATVKQGQVVGRIMAKMQITSAEIYQNNYLDVEPLFRKAGWKVMFDKPGYNETYEGYFVFSKE